MTDDYLRLQQFNIQLSFRGWFDFSQSVQFTEMLVNGSIDVTVDNCVLIWLDKYSINLTFVCRLSRYLILELLCASCSCVVLFQVSGDLI